MVKENNNNQESGRSRTKSIGMFNVLCCLVRSLYRIN